MYSRLTWWTSLEKGDWAGGEPHCFVDGPQWWTSLHSRLAWWTSHPQSNRSVRPGGGPRWKKAIGLVVNLSSKGDWPGGPHCRFDWPGGPHYKVNLAWWPSPYSRFSLVDLTVKSTDLVDLTVKSTGPVDLTPKSISRFSPAW